MSLIGVKNDENVNTFFLIQSSIHEFIPKAILGLMIILIFLS